MRKTVLFQTTQFSISTQFSSIWPINRTLSGVTTLGQSESGSDGNERVLCIPQSSSITGNSPSDCLVSYPGMTLVGVIPFYRGAVSVFYSPSRLGNIKAEDGILVTERVLVGHVTCDASLRPLFELDRWSKRPDSINRLVMSSLSTYMIKSWLCSLNYSNGKQSPSSFYLKSVRRQWLKINHVEINTKWKNISTNLSIRLTLMKIISTNVLLHTKS